MSSITFNVVLPDFRKNAVKISKFEVQFVCRYDNLAIFFMRAVNFRLLNSYILHKKFLPPAWQKALSRAQIPRFFPS